MIIMKSDSRKGILFVFHGSNKDSGATKSLIDIIDYLVQTDEYRIFATVPQENGNLIPYLQQLGIETRYYKYGDLICDLNTNRLKQIAKYPLFFLRHLRILSNVQKAANYYKSKDIDIVYSNTSTLIFGGLLGEKIGASNIWHIREFGLLDHHIQFYLGEQYIEKFIQEKASAVCCVSKAVLDYHSKNIDKAKMFVTYNSYPKSFIYQRNTFNVNSPLNVLVAGDIKSGKGQLIAVEAIQMLDKKYPGSIKLHLAGRTTDGHYFSQMKDYISQNKLQDKVAIYGQVSDMYSLRKKMDVGVVSSENEAFGRTTIEGMLSTMCMIGRNSGGTSEQIEDNRTGFLYDGTPEDLARKLEIVLLDRDKMAKLALSSFELAVEKYTNNYAAKISKSVIDRILEEKS